VLLHNLADFESGMRLAVIGNGPKIRLATGRHQDGEAAGREAERTDAIGIDAAMIAPRTQHVVNQQLQLARPLPDRDGIARVARAVAIVRKRGDDKPRIGERRRGVEMPGVEAFVTVGYHHQRQTGALDRRVAGDHLLIAFNRLQLRRGASGIPNAYLDRWPLRVRDAEMLEADRSVSGAGGGCDERGESLCNDGAHGTSRQVGPPSIQQTGKPCATDCSPTGEWVRGRANRH
jgi:hypothetical protein